MTGSGNASGSMRGLAFKAKPDFEDPGDANTDNIYEVTVVATDGSGNSGDESVTVKVTDRDETGEVELSTQNPVVGTEIMATLTDSDTYAEAHSSTYVYNNSWKWHRLALTTTAVDDTSAIPDATSETYTPKSVDIGMHLIAVARYLDRTYDEDNIDTNDEPEVGFENEVMSAVTTKVLASATNKPPKFREGSSAVRLVAENTVPGDDAAGGKIGDTVVAVDPDGADSDLSYELGGEDAASFELTPLMGNQLRVRAGTMLNYETTDTYTVVVMAKDGSGQANDTASITVTIMVVDVDEEPTITEAGLMVSGRKAISDYNENATVAVETYSALGPDAAETTWTVSGADAGYFSISRSGGELGFKNPPNYEMPLDEGANGIYMITVVANDGINTAMMDVAVTVANVDEPGVITLNPDRPGVGSMITATLTDPDGDTSNVVWGWQRSTNKELGWNSIPGTTSDTYTMVAADGGHYLRAVATYTDPEGAGKRAEQTTTTGLAGMRPTFAGEAATRTIPENAVMGMAVGAPVAAVGADNYSLGGTDAESFDIDSATGQITVGQGTTLDADTKATYTVIVTATDSDGLSDAITVTITVTMMTAGLQGDTNNDGMIDKPEVIAAFRAYVADSSDKTVMIAIFRQYVADAAARS